MRGVDWDSRTLVPLYSFSPPAPRSQGRRAGTKEMAPVSRHMYSRKESFTTSHLEGRAPAVFHAPRPRISFLAPPTVQPLCSALTAWTAITNLVSAAAGEARNTVATWSVPDHPPCGENQEEALERDPGFKTCGDKIRLPAHPALLSYSQEGEIQTLADGG